MKLLSSVAAVVVFAVPALLQQCTPPPPGELTSVRSGTWDDAGTWGGSRVPTQNDKVTISPGHTVSFPSARSYFVATTKNVIVYGTLQMRPANASVTHTLRFTGVNPGSFVGGTMDPVDSDVGLWVVGSGRLDIAGTPATGWLRAAGGINAGSTAVALESTPLGWRPGDEVAIAPTESPAVGTASFTGFDEAALTSVGQTIGLSRATTRTHPLVDGRWSAEIANLSRNVRIEGEAGRQSHIFIRSSAPSTIRYAALRHMGTTVLGRYAIHFHMAGDGSRGSLVEGTVVRDSGGHAYVSHLSNGVTFRDTVAYNVLMDAYWWDPSQNSDCPECGLNPSHDVTYQHALAAKVLPPPGTQGYRMAGFELGAGDRNRCIDCTAVGIQGNLDASGFEWPEGSKSEWVFTTGNRTHNNKVDGIFNWQNTANSNLLAGFASFHNQGLGVDHGAYKNVYHFEDCHVYGNRQGGFRLRAISSASAQVQISRCTIDSAGLYDSAIIDQDHFLPGSSYTTLISNSVLKGAQIGLKFSPFENNQPNQTDLVCNQVETPQDVVIEPGRPAGDRVRLQDCAGNAWEITQAGRQPIPRFA